MRKLIGILLIVATLIASVFIFASCNVNVNTQVKTFNLEKESFKVGIISDSQLSPKGEEDEYYRNLKQAFTVLKTRGVDMIIFAGDVGDLSKKPAYELYNKAINSVFAEDKPIFQTIMGNHDYWYDAVSSCRSRFEKTIGTSPWTHYVVNGIHFIGASPASGDMDNGNKGSAKWLKEQIEKAIADNPNKPIFVTTHVGAQNTMYGSDEWGDKSLYETLKSYPQVVNFSGHSHYSVLDERSIHQEAYTSIQTQSVSYIELERGKENGTIPPNASITPMGYVMDVFSDKFEIHRINFASKYGVEGKEEKYSWILPMSLNKDSFTYTFDARKENNLAPTMTSETGEVVKEEGKTYLSFASGSDDDFVHSYKMEWSNGKNQLYFSDYYNGLDDMAKTSKIEVLNMKKGTYSVKVYAIDTWGAVSSNYTLIENVNIG